MTVNRSASAPKRRITSSGSIPFPADLDILRPCSSCTTPVSITVSNGRSPRKWYPSITMRATQKKMISGAVTSVCPG